MSNHSKSRIAIYALVLAALGAFSITFAYLHWDRGPQPQDKLVKPVRIWTCLQHPEVREPEPGNCRICGLRLVPQSLLTPDPSLPAVANASPQSDR